MTSLVNKLKVATIGLGLLVLTALPLNAQGKSEEREYFRKVKMEQCLSKSGRSYSPHSKKEKVEIYCLSKQAKRDNYTVMSKPLYENYCVSSQAKRYNKHFHKENRKE